MPSPRVDHPQHAVPRAFEAAFDFNERPFLVIWEVTRACHLACQHCRATAQPRAHPEQLTPEEGRALIRQVAELRPALFILTGGDPVLRADLLPLIEYASGLGLRVGISPSATPKLLKADFHALAKAGVRRLSLSIDGATRATHDAFRGVRGAWEWTFQAIEKAREAGITIQINTTITRWNMDQFEAFAELMDTVQPEMWSIFLVVPTGRAGRGDVPNAAQTESFLHRLYDHSLKATYPVKTTEAHHYRRIALQRGGTPETPQAPVGIADGRGFVFISHTGEICPSGFLPLVAGNTRVDSLADIYRNSLLFKSLRDVDGFKGKCGYCEYRKICGGSRARTFAMTGDPLASEPLCIYQPQAART